MSVRWRVTTWGPDSPIVLGDVTAPDRRRALEVAQRQWPDRGAVRVQSHASVAVAAGERGALARRKIEAKLVATSEAARQAGVSRGVLAYAIRAGRLPAVRAGREVLVDPASACEWAAARTADGEGDELAGSGPRPQRVGKRVLYSADEVRRGAAERQQAAPSGDSW